MKSKSSSLSIPSDSNSTKQNRTLDFVKFYKPAAETSVRLVDKRKSDDASKDSVSNNVHTPKRRRSPKKIKKTMINDSSDVSNVNIDGNGVEDLTLNDSKISSTPNMVKDAKTNVKSIIKNKSQMDSSLNVSNVSVSSNKPKKRNKSVSFMLDDNEEVAIKRSKSEEMVSKLHVKSKKTKNPKKKHQDEKENKADINNIELDIPAESTKALSKFNSNIHTSQNSQAKESEIQTIEKEKKKGRKDKKAKPVDQLPLETGILNAKEDETDKQKKIKKKKNRTDGTDNPDINDEPAITSSEKDMKPDKIAQDLENLNIGDNAHTLTNLLDEMTVIDKNKRKKHKRKSKEGKEKNKEKKVDPTNADNIPDSESNTVEEKEKVVWSNRKWNKDKKGGLNMDKHLTSVVIENLPLKIMFNYKKLLTEHFEKFGMIKQIGIAEVYPTEDPKPVFTTTIFFYSEDAAEKALEEDNASFQGVRIRVQRPLPPALSTLVVRSFGELSEQAVSSVFSGAGRIRSIRHLIKGRKAMSTVFIEFDSPRTVEKAIEIAQESKIGGKKIHVDRFEERVSKKKVKEETARLNIDASEGSNS